MAASFDGSTSILQLASAVATAVPLTMAIRFNPTAVNVNQSLLAISNKGNATATTFELAITSAAAIRAQSTVNGTAASATGISNAANGKWDNIIGIFRSATNRQISMSGERTSTVNATSSTPASLSITSVGGRFVNNALNQPFNGRLADAAIWNIDLTLAEAQQYIRGQSPLEIRPQSLVLFMPLDGDTFDYAPTRNNYAATAISLLTEKVGSPWVMKPVTNSRHKFWMANSGAPKFLPEWIGLRSTLSPTQSMPNVG